jgi:hypothetical protein
LLRCLLPLLKTGAFSPYEVNYVILSDDLLVHSVVFLQEAIAALRQQLQQKSQQQPGPKKAPPPCPVQSAAPDASAAADTAPTACAPQAPLAAAAAAGGTAKDQPAAATAAAGDQSKSKAEAKAAVMAEVAALKDMEAQLARLSATVKSYQGEREKLRQALMAGLAERQALQQQVRLWSVWGPTCSIIAQVTGSQGTAHMSRRSCSRHTSI